MWTQKHGIKIAGGRGSQLAGVMIGTGERPSFFVIIILLHMSCVLWHNIIPSLIRRIAPHIPLKITTHTFNLFFLPILVWHAGDVPRRGECRELFVHIELPGIQPPWLYSATQALT